MKSSQLKANKKKKVLSMLLALTMIFQISIPAVFAEGEENQKKIIAFEELAENVKNSAYEIIAKKKATYFGVAMAVRRICEAIIRDEKSILPVSNLMHGEFGISDISLSMPAIVGAHGVENRIPITLDEEETEKLQSSAGTLKKIIEEVL